jgi:hypothetical protein
VWSHRHGANSDRGIDGLHDEALTSPARAWTVRTRTRLQLPTITGSCATLASNPSVLASVTISGTIAEPFQALNDPRASPQSVPEQRLLKP